MTKTPRFETRFVVELGEDVSGALDAVLRERQEGVELPRGAHPSPRLPLVAAPPTLDGPPVMRAPEQHRGYRRKEQIAPRGQADL